MTKQQLSTLGLTLGVLLFTGVMIAVVVQPDPRNAMSSRELLSECTTDMATTFHIHSHLTLIVNTETLTIPAEIGIDEARNCMSSLHTHKTDGIIHIEAPVKKDFTLGDFFYNWGTAFNATQLLDYKVDETHGLKMFVDGIESTDFENLILADDQSIVLDYYELEKGPDPVPANYVFED